MNEQLRIAFPVLWPAMAITAALLLVAWWPRVNRSATNISPGKKGWAGALALGLAFAASFAIIVGGLPKYPIPERWQWMLPAAGFATGCGVVAGLVERVTPARWVVGLISAALVGFTFHPLPSASQPELMRAIVACATAGIWLGMETSARRHRGFSTPLLLSVMFTGVSLTILHGGNANISLLAAAVAASLGIACAIALLLPPLTLAGGATHVISALLITLTATAWMYEIGHKASLMILAFTPLLVRGVELLLNRAEGWKSFAIRLLATAIPVGTAVVIAVFAAANENAGGYAY